MASSLYEAWVTRLRVSWMGRNGRRIFGGFAKVLGDLSYDYALQGTLEHLPATASQKSVALIASERQIETALGETTASIAAREPYAAALHRYDGTPLRLLLGLHFAGIDGAVVVQQNGRQFSLTLPLPAFADGWDPKPNLVVSDTAALTSPLSSPTPGHPAIPAGTPWFALDNNPDLANRFAIIFPTWPFAALGFAFFNDSDSAVVTWTVPFGSAVYKVAYGAPTSGVELSNDATAQTNASATIRASGRWTGIVWCIGCPSGVSPFNTFSAESVSLIQSVVNLCRPEKSYCAGVYAILSGEMWDYPVGVTWDGDSNLWDSSTTTQILGAF